MGRKRLLEFVVPVPGPSPGVALVDHSILEPTTEAGSARDTYHD